MLPNKITYFDEGKFLNDIYEFTGKHFNYFKRIVDDWNKNHKGAYNDLITGKKYSREELFDLYYNHPVYNAYGYATLTYKTFDINPHLNRPWIQKIKKEFTPGKKILDFGFGDLTNAIVFYDMGYKVTVVDLPIEWLRFFEFRCKKYNVKIDFRFTFDDKNFLKDNDEFDIIFSHEVLEHVHDPDKVIAYLIKHLKKNGLLFLTVLFSTDGGAHLKENYERFGKNDNPRKSKKWEKILRDLSLISIGNNFYKKNG